MKYLDTLKHWSTYFLALWIELVTTRAEMVFCFRRKDYGYFLGNLMIVAAGPSLPDALGGKCRSGFERGGGAKRRT